MITFKELSIQNFFSYGNVPTVFDLTGASTTLITGANGSGKSTIIDGICFALFGKPFKNVNKGTVVNSINLKKCVVICDFEIGTDNYKVIRGIKPNIFEIYKNDEMLDQEAAIKDSQKILEENILQLNYKTFTQIAIMASANFQPFMQLTAADRRNVVEDLLDIRVFSIMSKLAKEKTSNVVKDISNIDNVISQHKSKIATLTAFITKIENEEKVQDAEVDAKITLLEQSIIDTGYILQALEEKKKALYETITDAPEISTKKTEYSNASMKMKHVLSGFVTEHNFLENNDSCQACKQPISPTFKAEKLITLSDSIAKRESALESAKITIKKYDDRLVDINVVVAEIKKIDSEITYNNSLISNVQWKIKQLQDEKNKAIVSVDDEKKSVTEVNKLLLNAIETKDALVESKSYCDVANIMLKDTGIKSSIVKQYVPILNKLINHYLETMNFFVKFTFDENFGDKIQLRQRDELSYYNLSEGQKKRIDLAVIFAFRKIAESKNICNTNLLFFDEILDSSLDAEGMDSVASILETFEGKNIYVISHREAVSDIFDRTIKVEMRNNYSVIV